MRIVLAGGGSGGPVVPLLAVAEQIKKNHPKAEFLLIGTQSGPERLMADKAGMAFMAIPAGKWRRYFSLANFITPVEVLRGFFRSRAILKDFRPDCILGAGSFVQVPVIWAAKTLSIPVVIHQQDLAVSLANRLCEFAASQITVSFEDSLVSFSSGLGLFYKKNKEKVVLTGNPFRAALKGASRDMAQKNFNLHPRLPTLLVMGGGTGAAFINKLIEKSLPELAKTVQIIHSTGVSRGKAEQSENYRPYEFITDMASAYAAADIVLSRAGLSTITELSNLGKVSIIIPMPDSHQEINAFFLFQERAALVIDQNTLTPLVLINLIRKLLFDHKLQLELKENISKIMPKNSTEKIADIVIKLATTAVK